VFGIRIQGFDDEKLTKYTAKHFFIHFFEEKKLQFTYPLASIKNVQATGRSPQALKREHPALQNMKFLNFFLFCG
jgi:hypothetical protein